MGEIRTLGRIYLRRNVIDGVESSPINTPDPEQGIAVFDEIDAAVAAEIARALAAEGALDDRVDDVAVQVAAAVAGQAPKQDVRFRSTSTGAIATAFINGTVHDGVTAVTGNSFLMDSRTAPAENGIYTTPATGAPVRRSDANTGDEMVGATVYVSSGTANTGKTFTCVTPGPITLETTALVFGLTGTDGPSVAVDVAASKVKTDLLWKNNSVDLTAAATVDLSVLNGDRVSVSGSGASIASFGTVTSGRQYQVQFSGANTLVHSSNLVCPGNVNLAVAAGDIIHVRSFGGSVWWVVNHIPRDGKPNTMKNVDNTSDANKPISTAAQAEITAISLAAVRSSFHSARIGYRTGTFSNGVFDALPAAWGLYGFQRLLSSYEGPLFRFRKGFDTVETDFYPDRDGRVSRRTLQEWHNAVLRHVTFYDQTGNGNHLTMADTARQGEIPAGTGDPYANYTFLAELLKVNSTTGFTAGLAGVTVGMLAAPSGSGLSSQFLFRLSDETTSVFNSRFALKVESGKLTAAIIQDAGGAVSVEAPATPSGDYQAVVARANFAGGALSILLDDTLTTAAPFTGATLTLAANDSVQVLNNNATTSINYRPFNGKWAALAVYRSALTDAEQLMLSEALRELEPNLHAEHLLDVAFATDVHSGDEDIKPSVPTRFFRDSVEKMTDAIATFNARSPVPAVFAINGDFHEDGPNAADSIVNLEEILAITGTFAGAKTFYTLGNHDIWQLTKAQNQEIWEQTSGNYGSFNRNGVHFVYLDANYNTDDDDDPHVGPGFDFTDVWIPPLQRAWLENDLSATTLPVVIFCHHTLDSSGVSVYDVNNAPAVRDIFARSGANILGVFTGHQHTNLKQIVGGLPYFRMQAMVEGEYASGNNAYAVINVYSNRVTVEGFVGQTSYS